MKRFFLVVSLAFTALSAPVGAQTNVTVVANAVDQFVTDLGPSLPNLAETGLLWSSAYIGEFPHLGVGLSVQGAFIPKATFKGVTDALGVPLPKEIDQVPDWLGLPIPAYTAEARIGGFILPFDFGVKFGYLPDSVKLTGTAMDYTLVGADVRIKLIDGAVIIPTISVGAGASYLKGSVVYGMGNLSLGSVYDGSGYYKVELQNSSAKMAWDAVVANAHAQASWDFLILTPFVGLDVSYANTNASAGFSSNLMVEDSPGAGTFHDATAAEIQNFNNYQTANGGMTFSEPGFEKAIKAKGAIAYKLVAGTSLNLFFFHVDLNAGYNLASKSLTGGVTARVTF